MGDGHHLEKSQNGHISHCHLYQSVNQYTVYIKVDMTFAARRQHVGVQPMSEILLSRAYSIFVTQIFAHVPRLNCCLIHKTSIQGCSISSGTKLQKIRFSNFTPQNVTKEAGIGIFKPNSHTIETIITSKVCGRFQPNFAQR